MDWEAMINYIKNGDQQLPHVTQASIAGTSSTEQPPLKDKSMWKAMVLYEYETFKATEGELLLDTYIGYLQVINDLKKCVAEKKCDNVENPKVIVPGMFKLSVSQSVSPISVTKTSCASNGVENLDTLSSVRRPKSNGVMWMRKGSSNNIKVDLSFVNHFNLNKNVKRYSRKNLMACNNSDTYSAFDCNNARNALCNARMNASVDVNDFFVFDDVSIRKSHVSKMPFRKKPHDSLNIVQICLWIINSGCSKHMTGNRSLLTNFVEKFPGTVRFGNNDFAMIAGYGDVVIGSMTIKKVYYVEGLGHNLFSIGQFCNKGLEHVRTDNGTEFKNKTLAKFFDEVEEVGVPSSNTQSISNNMIPNVDEASTSYNVFNERLEDAYFDASTSFHDLSNVHTFYQPYPHEKKWTKDHPLYKIIGDPKSNVRTRGQLANSCLFSCLLSSIEPAKVAEALRDVD
nr:integrase, catalytic region, zinc finger, CCHC-type, peptidase aspartic, catalytic [Tanacetum cinerariifolium]